jgi:hypothetical protein
MSSTHYSYLLTPWSRVLLEKLTVNFAASQENPLFFSYFNEIIEISRKI